MNDDKAIGQTNRNGVSFYFCGWRSDHRTSTSTMERCLVQSSREFSGFCSLELQKNWLQSIVATNDPLSDLDIRNVEFKKWWRFLRLFLCALLLSFDRRVCVRRCILVLCIRRLGSLSNANPIEPVKISSSESKSFTTLLLLIHQVDGWANIALDFGVAR